MAKSSTSKSSKSTTSTTETVVATPVVATPVVATPVVQESSKKSKSTATPAAVATPVVAPVVAPVAAPVVAPVATPVATQEGGKSKKSKSTTSTPASTATPAVVATPVVATPASVAQEGGKSKRTKSTTPVPATTPVVATPAPVEGEEGGNCKRFFRCVYRATDGSFVNGGRYSGKKPKQAASKALKAIVKKNNVTTGEEVTFLIQECTRGSKKKKYSYKGSQVDLAEPVKIKITKKDGSAGEIAYRKHSVVKKIKLEECGDLVNAGFGDDDVVVPAEQVEVVVQATPKGRSRSSKKSKGKTSRSSKKTTKA